MNIVLDIAAALSAIVWPVVVLAILLAYRSHVPTFVGSLASRLNKLEFAGFSLELAQAKPFVPGWPASGVAPDLRHQAAAVQMTDSFRSTFLTQLNDAGTGDYAEINLGRGMEWLTSRLFIMAILFARMKGLRCFVFVETTEAVRKKFVGWAEPDKVRWALAKRFPWLEAAYASAYSQQMSLPGNTAIVSHQGRLAYADVPNDALASMDLLGKFLRNVQNSGGSQPHRGTSARKRAPPPVGWIEVGKDAQEHASWVSAEELETILGDDLRKGSVRSSQLKGEDGATQMKEILSVPGPFIAVTADDGRFEYLLRGDIIVEQAAKMMTADSAGRT